MRIIFSFALAILLLSFSARAQNSQPSSSQVVIKLDENAIVKGTNGVEYPYNIWIALMRTGKYSAKLVDGTNPKAPVFSIFELTEEQLKARNERAPKPRESGSFKDGDEFKPFNFRDFANNKFKAEDLTGKVIVLNFWFINCGPCRQEIPDLNELVEAFKDKEVIFIALALDSWSEIDEFLDKTSFNYHILPDSRYTAARYKVNTYPTHVVIDKSSKVTFQTSGLGGNTIYWVKKSIDQALAVQ